MIESMLISSLLGKEFISQTITNTTKTTYSSISDLLSNKEFKFKNLIEKLDINCKIKIIDKLILEISDKKLHQNDTIHLALIELHQIIDTINIELEEIKNEINEYNNYWFKLFYTNPYTKLIEKLTIHNQIMEKRLDLLLKLLLIP